ncbi:uncharacterized protein [Pocillopora verrucosa]|uniref:uncharacterized protein n=1 Tax=Pocillopora verrucosa TaxID=203993 RepID=UPI003341770C
MDEQPDPPAGTSIQESNPEILEPSGIDRKLSLLPQTVPHFVNRETECDEIRKYLSPQHNCRCLLIHGVTGIGKTTVATKVANDILNSGGSTVVIYVNCRNIKLSHDFAEKALQQVYHAPVENPIPELKNRLKSQDFFTILLLDNFEFILNLDDRMQLPENELSLQQNNPSEEGSKIKNLINDILMVAGKVKLLLTSSEKVSFPEAGQEILHLSSFTPEESINLLRKVWKDRQVNITQAHDLSEICSGIPLVLYTLASSHSDLPSLLEAMRCPSPQKKFDFFRKIQTVSEDMKINVCIDHCFERLDLIEKHLLIRFALLKRRFSLPEAVKIFQSTEMSASQLRESGMELSKRSLLEERIDGDECSYTLLRVIRDYCETKAMEQEFRQVILDARRMFIRHFLTFLEDIFKMFLSQNVSEAIAAFQKDEANVMQLVEWCKNGQMDEEQTRRCIDVFNSVTELLAKMMGKAKFEYAFKSLRKRCEEMKDQTRLSDCLTSLGLKEVFSCSCPPIGPCALHAEIAKEYFTKADRIQRNLGVKKGNSRAQCLAKLGRCIATVGFFEEAKEKVQQAIRIRSEGQDDDVMLGATYNDLGVILSLEGNHEQAINVRERKTLPIYRRTLGKHPFTATVLNSLSNNYFAQGEYNTAELHSKDALEIRLELLKDHRDTAKSLFDLAMVHKMKEEFKTAKEYLERCEAMQKKILDDENNDLTRTRNELEEVRERLLGAMQGNS